MKAIVY